MNENEVNKIWRRYINSEDRIEWQNVYDPRVYLTVSSKIMLYKKIWEVHANSRITGDLVFRKLRDFDTKAKAIKFAKKWMLRHPKG